jgi:hypothetical protein
MTRLPLVRALVLASATAYAGPHFGGFGGGAHFSGGVHFGGWGGGARVHVGSSVHWSSGGYRPQSFGVSGHIYVGGGYYGGCGYYDYNCGYPSYSYYSYVPSYYSGGYYPVEAAYGGPSTVAVAAPRLDLPKLGIGLFAGGVQTADPSGTGGTVPNSTDVGVLARYRLTPGFLVEGELGKTSYNVQNINNLRVDRRLGGSLIYEIGAYNALAPYGLVGLGVQQADVGGNYSTTQDFAEIGAGLRLAVTPHFHIAADIRAGTRQTVSSDKTMPAPGIARTVTPPVSGSNVSEDYTRGRLSAILYF